MSDIFDQPIRPIQTEYHGYLFRSRLEARWAVFFDALGVSWSYEHEGYDLGTLGWYLPDFLLTDWPLWVEIKGQDPTFDELARCEALAQATHAVMLCVGVPQDGGHIWCFFCDDSGGGTYHNDSVFWIAQPHAALVTLEEDDGERQFYHDAACQRPFSSLLQERGFWEIASLELDNQNLRNAVRAARSARFEHGAQR